MKSGSGEPVARQVRLTELEMVVMTGLGGSVMSGGDGWITVCMGKREGEVTKAFSCNSGP